MANTHYIDIDGSFNGTGIDTDPWSISFFNSNISVIPGDIYKLKGDGSTPNHGLSPAGDGTGTIFTNWLPGIPWRFLGGIGNNAVTRKITFQNALIYNTVGVTGWSFQNCYINVANGAAAIAIDIYGADLINCTVTCLDNNQLIVFEGTSANIANTINWLNLASPGMQITGGSSLTATFNRYVSQLTAYSPFPGNVVGPPFVTIGSTTPIVTVSRPGSFPTATDTNLRHYDLVPGYGVGATGQWAAQPVAPVLPKNVIYFKFYRP